MDYAAEARRLFVVSRKGQIQILNHRAKLVRRAVGFDGVQQIHVADSGEYAIAAMTGGRIVCLDAKLKRVWQTSLTGEVLGMGISPYGSHAAICTESSSLHMVSIDKKEIAQVEVTRPLNFVSFLHEEPLLIGAAEFGHLVCYDLKGRLQWDERVANNVGQMVVSGCGKRIMLAAFALGIQVYTKSGRLKESHSFDGEIAEIAGSSTRKRLAARTLDERLCWIDYEGNMKWSADLSSDPVSKMCVGPMGDRMFMATKSGQLLHLLW